MDRAVDFLVGQMLQSQSADSLSIGLEDLGGQSWAKVGGRSQVVS